VSAEPVEVKSGELRKALMAEMDALVAVSYGAGKAKYNIHQQGEDGNHQIIEISCLNSKLESFWAGEWQSTWTLKDGGLSGNLKIRCHYFEMGNMHFNLSKCLDSVPCRDAANAKDIVAAIKAVEDEYQADLDDMYKDIQQTTLRRMRRAVPVTGQKFDWDRPVGIYQ